MIYSVFIKSDDFDDEGEIHYFNTYENALKFAESSNEDSWEIDSRIPNEKGMYVFYHVIKRGGK